jgi:hypothetical protein
MTTTQTTATAATYAIIESRRGVHVKTVPGFWDLAAAARRANADVRRGNCDSAAIWTATEQVATFGSGR